MTTYGGPPPRLIDVRTLELVSIVAPGPRYAILSHTWGGAEVSFQEWLNGGSEHKEGYAKILGACREAQRNRLDYLWCDTCCIDKQSSAEFSRAINSMYGWYQRAAVCFAYLSDLRVHVKPGILHEIDHYVDGSPEKATLDSLSKSRWFTRGWTLQELIAPHDVWFFGSDWTPLGNLDDLVHPIARITGIDRDALTHRKPLTSFSLASRLSWAAARQTKEIEDQAYCLLGICEVNLAPTYGEGRNAFLRLQEQLFKTGDDSVLAWNTNDATRATDLYAASPSDFASCSDIVLDRSRAGQSNFWVMNVGLTGFMFTLKGQDERERIAVLSCRRKHAPDELLGLCLEAESLDDRVLTGRYSIRERYGGSRFNRRLHAVSKSRLTGAKETQITISKHRRQDFENSSRPEPASKPQDIFDEFVGRSDGGASSPETASRAVPGLAAEDLFAEFFGRGGNGASGSTRSASHGAFEQPRKRSKTPSPPRGHVPETTIVERQLPVTLENIFYGVTKKIKVKRKSYDPYTGRTSLEDKILEIPITRGMRAGTKIKFANIGDPVDFDGDVRQHLHFIVEEKPHALYVREKDNLQTTVEISMDEAVSSWERIVKTIDGYNVRVRSRGVTTPSFEEVFPGLGLPHRKDPSTRGDFIIKVKFTA